MKRIIALTVVVVLSSVAKAKDIRGLEVCTAEKAMERRTGCLQSNFEFLQQALTKQARETKARLDAADREAAARKSETVALKSEIAALKNSLVKLQQGLAESQKSKPARN